MKKAIKILAIVCLGMFFVGCTDAKTTSNSASGESDNSNSQINVTEASNLLTDNYSVSNQNGGKNNATTNANDVETSEEAKKEIKKTDETTENKDVKSSMQATPSSSETITDESIMNKNLTEHSSESTEDMRNQIQSHTHSYSKNVILASCNNDGYTSYECKCGDTYKTNYITKTRNHDFQLSTVLYYDEFEKMWLEIEGYKCTKCSLNVLDCGNADCSWYVERDVKYYVTAGDEIELVIYGNGAMPEYEYDANVPEITPTPWNEARYSHYIKTITIADGITSIGKHAFSQEMSSVKNINIGKDVTTIGWYALKGLTLAELKLGENVKTVGYDAINYANMKRTYWPKTLTCVEKALPPASCKILYQGNEEDFGIIKVSKQHWINVYWTMNEHISNSIYRPSVTYNAW